MSKFKSKEAKVSNYTPKTFGPGEHYCRVVGMELNTPPFDKDAYNLQFTLESVEQPEGFEGFFIDPKNEGLGRYKGQIGFVNNSKYTFSTFVYQGKTIERDDQIFNFVNMMAKNLGILEAIQKDNVEGNTIEDYVTNVKKYFFNPDLWAWFVICGQEYQKEGSEYVNFRLFFPNKGKFVSLEMNDDTRMKYDESKHIIKLKKSEPKEIDDFESEPGSDDMFSGDPINSDDDPFAV